MSHHNLIFHHDLIPNKSQKLHNYKYPLSSNAHSNSSDSDIEEEYESEESDSSISKSPTPKSKQATSNPVKPQEPVKESPRPKSPAPKADLLLPSITSSTISEDMGDGNSNHITLAPAYKQSFVEAGVHQSLHSLDGIREDDNENASSDQPHLTDQQKSFESLSSQLSQVQRQTSGKTKTVLSKRSIVTNDAMMDKRVDVGHTDHQKPDSSHHSAELSGQDTFPVVKQSINLFEGEVLFEDEAKADRDIHLQPEPQYEEESDTMVEPPEQEVEEPSLTEKALKVIPKGSFRIDSVDKNDRLNTRDSNKSVHSQYIDGDDHFSSHSDHKRERNTNTADSNYLNFSNKSFKKILIKNNEELQHYYDLDRQEASKEEMKEDPKNKLNLVTKFRERQIEQYLEHQKIDRKLYIREQADELEHNFNKSIDDNLQKKRGQRRILGIALGTDLPPEKKIIRKIQKNIEENEKLTKEQMNDKKQDHDRNNKKIYSRFIAKEIESKEDLQVMHNIIQRIEKSDNLKKPKHFIMTEKQTPNDNSLKFDFEKIKSLYNVSLLENGMMTQSQIYAKRKQDAKDAVVTMYKRQREEKMLLQRLIERDVSQQECEQINQRIKLVTSAKEISLKRIEWLVKGTNFTTAMLEKEIQDDRHHKQDPNHKIHKESHEQYHLLNEQDEVDTTKVIPTKDPIEASLQERDKFVKFQQEYGDQMKAAKSNLMEENLNLEDKAHKPSRIRYDKEAKEARDFLSLSIIEVRALKNRLGVETIADFLMLYKEHQVENKIDSLASIINESFFDMTKTQEFIKLFDKIYKFELEIRRVGHENRIVNLEKKMEKKIFTDYAPEHLDLDEEEKQVFLDNFTKPKLIYEYAPYWYTPMFIDEDRFSKDIRRMMCNTKNEKISKYEISEEQLHYICNHLE